ncbi:LacI family DNA-binding transcriptional regulator [Vallitalea okinawensis]|uniref:LacI family DNA-binding transcriptional regulator n=1 Tax=Vallitalea okinawensis TaxID=2078660 RepID=UPI000CFC9964|nr:LacI family DNA-binding transcriptional regulator [Vallitalea okinawensis]
MAVTMKELAEVCNVSRGTVDRALNNRPGINEETRRLVLETAERLGYRRHYLASSLKKGKTSTIGVIVFDLHNQFFSDIINPLERRAKELDYFVYLTLTEKDKGMEEACVQQLVDRQVDGIIIASVNNEEVYINKLKALDIPVISICNKISDSISFVDIKNDLAMYDATKFVVDKGYDQIFYISPPLNNRYNQNIYAQEQRYFGFLRAVKESAVRYEVIESSNYLVLLEEQISMGTKPGILCSSDIFALRILKHFNGLGYEVKKDFGLMGFDNLDMLKFITPRLTTVAYPFEHIGTKSLELLIDAINNDNNDTQCIEYPYKIIEGQTL